MRHWNIPGIKEYYDYQDTMVMSTGLHRGYIAVWEVANGHLYLNEVRGGNGVVDENYPVIYANLEKMFPDKYENGRVVADWVTGSLYAYRGRLIYYSLYMTDIAETEIEIITNKGVVASFREYNTLACNDSPDTLHITNSNGRADWDTAVLIPNRLIEIINKNFDWDTTEKSEIEVVKLYYFIDDDFKGYILTESGNKYMSYKSDINHSKRIFKDYTENEEAINVKIKNDEKLMEDMKNAIPEEIKKAEFYVDQISKIMEQVNVEILLYEGRPFYLFRSYELHMVFDPKMRSVRHRSLPAH